MSLRRLVRKLAVLLAPLALVAAGAATARAQSDPAGNCATGNCATGNCGVQVGGCADCQKKDCPPKFIVCTPKPPKICFKCACPKPICDPCQPDPTGNYGYLPVCWRPWMAPPNYSHCPVPSPTQLMDTHPGIAPEQVIPDNPLPPEPKLESQMNPPKTMPNTVAVAAPTKTNTVQVQDTAPTNTMLFPVPPPVPAPMSMDDVLRTPKQDQRVETLPTLP